MLLTVWSEIAGEVYQGCRAIFEESQQIEDRKEEEKEGHLWTRGLWTRWIEKFTQTVLQRDGGWSFNQQYELILQAELQEVCPVYFFSGKVQDRLLFIVDREGPQLPFKTLQKGAQADIGLDYAWLADVTYGGLATISRPYKTLRVLMGTATWTSF